MTDLLDAIDQLTKPVINHYPQTNDDGKWLRAHTTHQPPLLEQLEQAIRSSTSGRAGGGNPAARSVLNSAALYEFTKIRAAIGDWCRIEKVKVTRNPVTDLRAWYVARLTNTGDPGWHTTQLRKWANTIRAQLEPPTVIPLSPPCVACDAATWENDDGDVMPFPVVVQYAAGETDILGSARATCRACGRVWQGSRELRELRFNIDAKETA